MLEQEGSRHVAISIEIQVTVTYTYRYIYLYIADSHLDDCSAKAKKGESVYVGVCLSVGVLHCGFFLKN